MKISLSSFLVVLDLVGTFVFGLSGATAGIKKRLDLFGVLVLSFAAATAGGLMRDLVIGAIPPAAITDLRYVAVPILAGLVMFAIPRTVLRVHHLVALFDAAGLALVSVSGTNKALAFGVNPVAAALLGMLTGIGGGIVRDILINEVPFVFQGEVYAVAALAASTLVVVGHLLKLPSAIMTTVAMLLCFGLRMIAIWRHWGLPIAAYDPEADGKPPRSDGTD